MVISSGKKSPSMEVALSRIMQTPAGVAAAPALAIEPAIRSAA
jgi:hypothetical protein